MLKNVLNFGRQDDAVAEDDLATEAAVAAQEKADRIAFHAERVRNGPVTFSHIPAGRLKSLRRKDQRNQARKVNRANRKAYRENLRRLMVLRGQLAAVGALPSGEWIPSRAQQRHSRTWLVENFGQPGDERHSFERQVEAATERALEKYRSATTRETLSEMGD